MDTCYAQIVVNTSSYSVTYPPHNREIKCHVDLGLYLSLIWKLIGPLLKTLLRNIIEIDLRPYNVVSDISTC